MKLKRPDYTNSILNVSNSFLKYYNVPTKYSSQTNLDSALQKGYNHIIYILLDGMGSNIIKHHLDKNDALRKYMVEEITSVFPPTTVAATNAVLSGKPPITTGYLGWVQYFEHIDSDLTIFLNKDFYTDEEPNELVRHKYLDYKDILEQSKEFNPNLSTNIIFPKFIEQGTGESFKDEIEQVLMITHNKDTSFNYVYWTQPDLIEHKEGIYSNAVKDMIKGLNNDFESLISNVSDDTLVVCIADHGLTDVEELNIFSNEHIVKMLKRKPSIEPRAINFFVKSEYITEFKTEFNSKYKDIYLLMTKADILESELFGTGDKHQLIDMFLGDYIAVAIDKYMFTVNDKKSYKAHHAGLTEDEMMVPLIIYSKK